MTPAALRRIVLDLVGNRRQPDLSGLSGADWLALDHLAVQHRLQPLLHYQHRASALVPEDIAAGWAATHRSQAMLALNQRADLARTVSVLRAAGFAPLALKGAWLSHYAYPEVALRPLRDIDLLLDADAVIPAFEHLQTAGYTLLGAPELSLADLVRTDKHLPPLLSPGGTVIELHHRLWEPNGRLDHASPLAIDEAVRRRAIVEGDRIAYPAPVDMLAHLIAHAVYSHRFDCGPLVLTDIDYLLRARVIDWAVFWDRAAAEGWRSGARLVLALVATYRKDVPITITSAAGAEPSSTVLADAENLLLQDLDSRRSARVLASVHQHGWRGLSDRLLGRRRGGDALVWQDKTADGGFAGWALSRFGRTVDQLRRVEPRRQGQALARLSSWLDAPGS